MLNRKLTILYGSQTYTAQDLAEQIYRESKLYHFGGPVSSMDHYDVGCLPSENIVVFVCSTTGQGDEPDNMRVFWKFLLKKSLASDSLAGVRYAVLGLGDSSYRKFNFVAKRLNKRLQQLGAVPLMTIGLCDDQHDLGASAVYIPWITELWTKLLDLCPLPSGLSQLKQVPEQCKWQITAIDDDKENNCGIKPDDLDIYENCVDAIFDKPFVTKVLSNKRTTDTSHFQDVRLISLDVTDSIRWTPGDVVLVRPQNCSQKVNELFELFQEHQLQLYPETIVIVSEIDKEMPVPKHLARPLSLKTVATQLWDLNAVPRPRQFELLAINCENELEKEKLAEFQTAEGQQDLFAYANRPRRTILETLKDFPHAMSKLNLKLIFELFTPIRPRSFSIASSCRSGRLDILVAIVEYKTILSTTRKGLCSAWLKELQVGDSIRAVIKSGTFRLPSAEHTPIVMCGPGTGLAPFRSILQHFRESQKHQFTLFFGCRNEKLDFHCENDLKEMEKAGFLRLITAFSRDQEDKIYVQHKIKEHRKTLQDLLQTQRGYFLLAGNSKNMPEAVRDALGEALGAEYLEQMIKEQRYQEEVWA